MSGLFQRGSCFRQYVPITSAVVSCMGVAISFIFWDWAGKMSEQLGVEKGDDWLQESPVQRDFLYAGITSSVFFVLSLTWALKECVYSSNEASPFEQIKQIEFNV